MRQLSKFIVGVTMFFGVIILTNCTSKEIGSRLVFKRDTLALGNIKRGQSTVIISSCRNIGNDSLKILKAKGGCSCTKILFDKHLLASGEESPVRLIYDNAEDNINEGEVLKSILIYSTASPTLKIIYLKGRVVK